MKSRVIFLVCFLGAWISEAQTTHLDKEAAFSAALDKNFGIQVSRNQRNIVKNNASVLNSGFLPTVSAISAANYNQDNSTIEFPGQVLADGTPRPNVVLDQAEAQRGGKLDESGLMDGSNIIELFVLFSDETSDGLGVTFDRLCLPTHALTAPTSSIEQKFEGALELLPCLDFGWCCLMRIYPMS